MYKNNETYTVIHYIQPKVITWLRSCTIYGKQTVLGYH